MPFHTSLTDSVDGRTLNRWLREKYRCQFFAANDKRCNNKNMQKADNEYKYVEDWVKLRRSYRD